MKRNMKEWKNSVLTSGARKVLPVMTYPGLKLVNKGVMDVIRDPQAQFECIEALAQKYSTAATVTIMDLSVEAEIFGSPVRYSEEDVPTVTARIVSDMESVEALKIPSVGEGRTPVYLNAARLAAEKIEDRPVFGGLIGPISLSARLYDMTEMMMAIILEPEIIHALLEKSTQFLVEYAKAFKATGANGIIIAEPAAGLLSPEQCQEFSSEYVKKIVDAVQDDSFMVILHNCGNTKNQVTSLLSTGAMGLHFGNAVDMMDILPQMPADRLAFGNIDPARVFRNGTVEDMKKLTAELLEKTSEYKNFVLSSGCDVPPGTPIENVDAFFATLAQYNAKK